MTRMVTQEFNIGWEHVMSSIHSIIIAYIDTRTGGDGGIQGYRIANNKHIIWSSADDILTAIG